MQQVNAAYEMGDRERLEELAKQWDASPESVKGEGIAADLVRVIRQISLVKDRIEAVEKEIAEVEGSEDYLMFSEARAKGLATYITDLEAVLDADIARLQRDITKAKGVMKCPTCGNNYKADANFCTGCGSSLSAPTSGEAQLRD